MVDPNEPAPPIEIAVAEEAARRVAWTPGRPLRLSDGAPWRLPRIDWALLLFRPDLLASIARAFQLADEVCRAESDVKRQTIAAAIYHSQLAQLGVALLQSNYELPDERWRRLVSFDRLTEMLHLTLAVSEAVAEAIPAWMPFHQMGGIDGAEDVSLN